MSLATDTIAAFNGPGQPDKLLVTRLRAADLTDAQIAEVLNAIDLTCRHCWDGPRYCPCCNDE